MAVRFIALILLLLPACTPHYGPPSPLEECKSQCFNPYGGFVTINMGLYATGVVMEQHCHNTCEEKFPEQVINR